jgi:putative membrane protein
MSNSVPSSFDPLSITRPDRRLLQYYILIALVSGPFFPIVFLPLYFKYHTLKYRFDDSGVSMSWGILFRREVYLTYRRIQDIHLTRNIVQRWLKLATVGVQTASGGAGPEMSIEGIPRAEELRDYLYSRMRGARGEDDSMAGETDSDGAPHSVRAEEATLLLTEIRDALQTLAEQGGTTA